MLSKLLHPIGLQNAFIDADSSVSDSKKKKTDSKLKTTDLNKSSINLHTLKKDDLRTIAKANKLRITGNKSILIQRIEEYKIKISCAIVIQSIFRRHLVQFSFRLRGVAFGHTELCNNQTDFYTLEPLSEIIFRDFYSYKDTSGFIYGFNVNSLIELMKTKGNVMNPYNREVFSAKTLSEIKILNRIIQIVFSEQPTNTKDSSCVAVGNTANVRPAISDMELQTSTRILQQYNTFSLQLNRFMSLTEYNTLVNQMMEIRRKTIGQRIVDLFIEIDLLGNYTQSVWFSSLNRFEYLRLYRNIYDIWSYRANLSANLKLRICPFGSPFHGMFTSPTYNQDVTLERIQNACLCVFENIVYTGVDLEHRKLGILHCLTALTIVSLPARAAIPWLYESVEL
jgi:hypothetical protein